MDYTAPLDAATLVVEVASGTYAFKSKIKAASIKLLWEKLSQFVASTLKEQKGVLLPNLGTFLVGPVVGETRKKVRPCFKLLESRYGSVSQERSRYIVGGRAPVVQPSYSQLSTLSGIHRGATQCIVSELLQRLGVHILSGRPIRCEFPGLGTLLTNRASRLDFVFEPLIMEHFEREHYALIHEMEPGLHDADMTHSMQRSRLSSPAQTPSPPITASGPAAHAASGTQTSQGGAPGLSPAYPPTYTGEIQRLLRLCRKADRIGSGTILRTELEGHLQGEVRGLLSRLDAASMLGLLARNTYGKTRNLILYQPFLQALQTTLDAKEGTALPAAAAAPRPSSPDPQHAADFDTRSELSFQAAALPAAPASAPAAPSAPLQQPIAAPVPAVAQPWQDAAWGAQHSVAPLPQQPQQVAAALPPRPATPQDYVHYVQSQLSPRSRLEFDNFNKLHFQRLQQARGPDRKRAITPKVGEEPLNRVEYQAVQQASPRGFLSAGNTPVGAAPGLVPAAGVTPSSGPSLAGRAMPMPMPLSAGHANGATAWRPSSAVPYDLQQTPARLLSPRLGYRPKSVIHEILQDPPSALMMPTTTSHTHGPPGQRSYPQQYPVVMEQQQHAAAPLPEAAARQAQQQDAYQAPLQTAFPAQQQNAYRPPQSSTGWLHQAPAAVQQQQQHEQDAWGMSRDAQGRTMGNGPHAFQQDAGPAQDLISPRPRPPIQPISYYDVMKAQGADRQRLKAELASELQQTWKQQIDARHEFEQAVEQAETRWPFNLTNVPNDKRPLSAISKPPASPPWPAGFL